MVIEPAANAQELGLVAAQHWYARPASMLSTCDCPPRQVASQHFQQQPHDLPLRGLRHEHQGLWQALAGIDDQATRCGLFHHYCIRWLWWHEEPARRPSEAELEAVSYAKLLRGWAIDSNGPSGAVLKGWAEHRFGLRPLYHGATLATDANAIERYSQQRLRGSMQQIYVQLDLLYTFCQDELRRRGVGEHLILYRGTHDAEHYLVKDVGVLPGSRDLVEFNALSSFSANAEVAWEFGSSVWRVRVPRAKIMYWSGLLPQAWLKSEDEYLVLGGDYAVERVLG